LIFLNLMNAVKVYNKMIDVEVFDMMAGFEMPPVPPKEA